MAVCIFIHIEKDEHTIYWKDAFLSKKKKKTASSCNTKQYKGSIFTHLQTLEYVKDMLFGNPCHTDIGWDTSRNWEDHGVLVLTLFLTFSLNIYLIYTRKIWFFMLFYIFLQNNKRKIHSMIHSIHRHCAMLLCACKKNHIYHGEECGVSRDKYTSRISFLHIQRNWN